MTQQIHATKLNGRYTRNTPKMKMSKTENGPDNSIGSRLRIFAIAALIPVAIVSAPDPLLMP